MWTLYHFPLCPFSRSIRLALAEYEMAAEPVEQRPWAVTREFLEMNPAGTLPVLKGPADLRLCGAYAISEYLADVGGRPGRAGKRENALFPGKDEARAEVRRLVAWFHRKFDEEVSQGILEEKLHQRYPEARRTPDPELIRLGRANLRYHLSYISCLAHERDWLAGERMSFADLAGAAHLSVMDYLDEMPWEDFPDAKAWYARLKSRPAFRALLADRLPVLSPPAHYTDLDF